MDTPIAIIIFNRPQTTERVVDCIAAAKPKKLFVIDHVDWECEVYKNYADTNLGCGQRPATGISWVFENTDRAIILEDDCVPHPSFFPFCEELLERYKDDERVMHISGRSVFPTMPEATKYSYYFSRALSGWGWATWARAWKHYDINIALWPELRNTLWLQDILGDNRAVKFFTDIFNHAFDRHGNLSYWDQQWNFTCWSQNGLGIRPYANLIEYIGFEDATHPFSWGNRQQVDFPSAAMEFPLKHPPFLVRNKEADQFNTNRVFSAMAPKLRRKRMKQFYRKVRWHLRKVMPR